MARKPETPDANDVADATEENPKKEIHQVVSIVRLIRNDAGHLAGETMTVKEANALGIAPDVLLPVEN